MQIIEQLGLTPPSGSQDGIRQLATMVDCRQLIVPTVPDHYPVPHIHEFKINCQYFTKVYMVSGYHQVPVCPEDIH